MRIHTEPHDEGHSVRRAFTLIELLVVIAIIGILAALLLPVLTRAKMRAQSAQCMNNSKQVLLGWIMYADDSADLLAPNDFPYTTSYFLSATKGQMQNWVVGTMEQSTDSKVWQELAPSTSNLHTNTCFSKYIANASSYVCPADHYIDPFSHGAHVRSYSMNSAVGTIWNTHFTTASIPIGAPAQGGWLPGAAYNSAQTTWQTYGKMTAMRQPSLTWVMLDENPYTINDGSFAVSALAQTGATYLIDYPSANHGGEGGMAFGDGHASMHRWSDSRTYSPQGVVTPGMGSTSATKQTPDDPDCFYLAPLTSQPN
jgi:prepilin-type N-terminal cleavage/methylation domain-containing protein